MSFQEILEFLNFLYSIGMLFEFAAFIKLRIKKPDLHRPYKVPLGTFGVTMLCVPPSILLVLVMCLASLRTFLVSGTVIILGFLLYPAVVLAKDRKWVHFTMEETLRPSDNDVKDQEIATHEGEEAGDGASVSLLSEFSTSATENISELPMEEDPRSR